MKSRLIHLIQYRTTTITNVQQTPSFEQLIKLKFPHPLLLPLKKFSRAHRIRINSPFKYKFS